MPKTKVTRIVNVSKTQNVPVELIDGSTTYLRPGQSMVDVSVMNLHKIRSGVRIEGEEMIEKGMEPLVEVMPKSQGKVDLTEVKPPKYKRGRILNG